MSMALLEILVAILLAVSCALWLLRSQRAKHGRRGKTIPFLPERCTFFGGHAPWFLEELEKANGVRFWPLYKTFMRHRLPVFTLQLGPPFRIGRVGRKMNVINDSSLAEEIKRSKDFGLNESQGKIFDELGISPSVIGLDGEKWKRHRRLMQPVFHRQQLKYSLEIIHRHTSNYLEDLKETLPTNHPDHTTPSSLRQKPVNLVDTFNVLTSDIIAEVGFSYNLQQKSEEKRAAFRNSLAAFVSQFNINLMQPSMALYRILHRKEYQEFIGHREFLKKELIYEIIKERQDAIRRGEVTPQDLLSLLLNAKDDESGTGEKFTEEEVINNAFLMYAAGYDTTAASMSWILYYLGKYPEVQEHVHSEVSQVSSEEDLASLEAIAKLAYLPRVVKEVMRLEPAGGFYARGALRDTVVQGYFFPAGSDATINIYTIHHSPDEWDEPEEFKPERWEKADGGCKKSLPSSFVPFGNGGRRCLGQPLALLEMKLIIALFVKKFKVILTDEDCKRQMPFIYKPGQVMVNLELR